MAKESWGYEETRLNLRKPINFQSFANLSFETVPNIRENHHAS